MPSQQPQRKKPAEAPTKSQVSSNSPNEIESDLDIPQIPADYAIEGLTSEQQEYLTTHLLRQTPEYQAAWTLELWKKNQQRHFLEHLEKERKRVENEWKDQLKARDEKRKNILQNDLPESSRFKSFARNNYLT